MSDKRIQVGGGLSKDYQENYDKIDWTKGREEDASEKGKLSENSGSEHQEVEAGRLSSETGSSDSNEQSREE